MEDAERNKKGSKNNETGPIGEIARKVLLDYCAR
jgi:hypothetical protein